MEGWYLDTGATNHMMGRCDIFSHLDQAVRGSVKFERNGKHKALDGVYYIPKLHNSIASVGQLNEIGSKIHIEDGVLRIRDRESRLLVRVPRSGYMLYVL
jgi:hypothetical protein